MTKKKKDETGPMPHTEAQHLLSPLRKLIQSPKRLIKRLELRPDSIVLEIGSGPGYFSPEIARSIPKGKLVLVDVQQEMLDMARERLEGKGYIDVEYHRCDAVSMPFETESFDVVFMVAVLGEISDRSSALREIHRVLRPDGLLSITEIKIGDPDFIPMKDLQRSAEAAGFS